MTRVLPGDERLLLWAHRQAYDSRLRGRLHFLEAAIPYGGCALVYCLLGVLALRDATRRVALTAMAAGVVAWLVSAVLKVLVDRPRPCLNRYACGGHSFPEGPGTVLAAIAVAVWPTSRPIAVVAALCALADGAAQLAYGNHWPSDLLGAWLIGGLCGLVVPRIAARLSAAGTPLGE
jgi:membrane-associated phospholipid phosphatase